MKNGLRSQTDTSLGYLLACLLLLVAALGSTFGSASSTVNKLSAGPLATSNNQLNRGASAPTRINGTA